MGALFSSPKQPDLPPPPGEDTEEAAARRRRGLRQTIRTGGRGLLSRSAASADAPKSLLGE